MSNLIEEGILEELLRIKRSITSAITHFEEEGIHEVCQVNSLKASFTNSNEKIKTNKENVERCRSKLRAIEEYISQEEAKVNG